MPEETPVGSEQDQPTEPERPGWLPEKFESAEALAKSYTELERKFTEVGQDKNNLEAQLEDLYGRMQAVEQQGRQGQYDPASDPTLLAYEQAMENGDYRAALAIQAGLMQSIAQQQQQQQGTQPHDPQSNPEAWAFMAKQDAIQKVGGQDEWQKYEDATAEKVQALEKINPKLWDGLSSQQAAALLVEVHNMAKAQDVLSNQQTLAEQQAEAERQAKLAARTTSGSSGRPPAPTKNEAEVSRILKAAEKGYEALMNG